MHAGRTMQAIEYMGDMQPNQPAAPALAEALETLSAGGSLARPDARGAMEVILRGEASPADIAALLTSLRDKGETVDEIVGFAEAMRAQARPVFTDAQPRPEGTLVDTCGTGGDSAGIFNVSTAAALVVAAAGSAAGDKDVRVAKHGNRSISSKCGSADVLEALGVNLSPEPERTSACIREVGIGFLFAPTYHASTRHAQPVRKQLGGRTVFNLLGPLTNPAGVHAQVVGVFDAKWLVPMAEALGLLGVRRAFVVHSHDGLDEVSLSAPTEAAELAEGKVERTTITPEDFGLERAPRETLLGDDAQVNAHIMRHIFSGRTSPKTDMVLLNAALALVAAGLAGDFREGADQSRAAIQSGAASRVLMDLAAFTR